ncbi:glycosyltransferase family 2 protein [Plantactinospora sp. S1510]|uniref:Glycosyltransferase family 2 protein n=1 Tax=Plantactinospora alkalitolerans TaxID=2789879 RepID=A0ABS0GTY1_9ACTN|nr:glycosyltransferase family A protein [Plantactinospora alkalitolerans]MBF9129665.1 glycosyltransferase family 2 protein [Plantactinospora alkalitolerans]
MPAAPAVSVVITTYNRLAVLPIAIDSVLAQVDCEFEVIVVDDGSVDDTVAELGRRYGTEPRLRVITRANGGPPAARNTGIDVARAEWTALLDSDDWWEPTYLRSQLAVLADNPGADMVLCNGRRQDQDGSWHNLFDNPNFTMPTSIEAMCAGSWIQPTFTVVRTEVARRIRFDEAFRLGDDQEFMWRFVEAGHHCVPNPEPLAEYRASSAGDVATEEQITADFDELMLGAYAVWKHHGRRHPSAIRRRGLDFDRLFGDMLLRHGRVGEARFHLWRWWLARPFEPRPAWLLLRSLARHRRAATTSSNASHSRT